MSEMTDAALFGDDDVRPQRSGTAVGKDDLIKPKADTTTADGVEVEVTRTNTATQPAIHYVWNIDSRGKLVTGQNGETIVVPEGEQLPDIIEASKNITTLDPIKTLESGSDSSVGFAVPPDTVDELEKNTPVAMDDDEDEQEVKAIDPLPSEPKFKPEDLVYSRSLDTHGIVQSYEVKGNAILYNIKLIGPLKENRGAAVLLGDDLELRRNKAAKGGAVAVLDKPAIKPSTLANMYRAANALAAVVEKDQYGDKVDDLGSQLQTKLTDILTASALTEQQRSGLEQARDAVDAGRLAWGEGDQGTLGAKFTSAAEFLKSLIGDFTEPDTLVAKSADVYDDSGGAVGVVVNEVDLPSMKMVVAALTDAKNNLDEGDADLIMSSLRLAQDTLSRIGVAESDKNVVRNIDQMKALIGRAERLADNAPPLSASARSRYNFDDGDMRNSAYNSLSQAAFLGEMLTKRFAVRSIIKIAARHHVPKAAAVRLWFDI